MLAKSAFMGLAAVLCLVVARSASATCTECDVPEESVLLQQKRADAELQTELHSQSSEEVWRCAPDVHAAQYAWKSLILSISQSYAAGGNYTKVAEEGIAKYYGYDIGKVLFKPTQAVEHPFRGTAGGALSYFVGCAAAGPYCIPEDKGFAIANGTLWSKVTFDNDQITCFGDDDIAVAMGYYYFTNNMTGNITAVEYSFGYKRMASGELKIVLHHSSIPYKAPDNTTNSTNSTNLMQDQFEESPMLEETAAEELDSRPFRRLERFRRTTTQQPTTGCESAVIAAQNEWKVLILSISSTYLADVDFVYVAKIGIASLYGYDIGRVLFKPTQAVLQPFRVTSQQALSYFVGYEAAGKVDGIPEDKGFAIAAGKGWSDVKFENDQISCWGDIAFAQGYYFFTNKESGDTVAVEYSFGYEKYEGKWKIVLHHSSIPYSE